MFGLLNIDKPAGVTSRYVVDQVQRIVAPAKAGHAGTLDPLATGVLVVCTGPATRLIPYVQRAPKRYIGKFHFGRESDTEDIEGNVVERPGGPFPKRAQLNAALRQFVGDIKQRPPAFSALKLNGRRAYDLARKGKKVDLKPRQVSIQDLRLVEYEYPIWTVEIRCGSGTYVRSLGRDIAEALGTVAVMSELQRMEIGHFRLQDACSLDELTDQSILSHLKPAINAVAMLPRQTLTKDERDQIANGITIEHRCCQQATEIAAVDAAGNLLAILVPRSGGLGPSRNFTSPEDPA